MSEIQLDIPEKKNDDVSDVILSLNNISKRFCRDLKRSMFYGLKDITSEITGTREDKTSLRKGEFWAVKNVSLELRQGQAIGLVGANGAGKTTLLKLISGLIKPDTGSISVKGIVAPLIALGAGFNPILSGRENMFINMSILGMTNKQIENAYDDVLKFAEIDHAIDAPLQTYSSGMAARLGFACAIHTNPDILLIDEVLAVGDVKFRAKCYRQLAKLRSNGTAFILVSHSAQSILSVCNEAVYLSKGQIIMAGEVNQVMRKYESELLNTVIEDFDGRVVYEVTPDETSEIKFSSISLKNDTHELVNSIAMGKPIIFSFEFMAFKDINDINLLIAIRSESLESEFALNLTSRADNILYNFKKGKNTINVKFPYCGLKGGIYNMKVFLTKENHYVYDAIENFRFSVINNFRESNSSYYQPTQWQES